MNTDNFTKFSEAYRRNLAKAHAESPGLYHWPITELDSVANRMLDAVIRGSFNKEGRAFVATCRELGIAHTYKAINAYINQ